MFAHIGVADFVISEASSFRRPTNIFVYIRWRPVETTALPTRLCRTIEFVLSVIPVLCVVDTCSKLIFRFRNINITSILRPVVCLGVKKKKKRTTAVDANTTQKKIVFATQW